VISFVAPSSREVIGYAPAELVGKNCLQFVAEQDRRDVRRAMIWIIRNAVSRTLLFRLNCHDGKQVWLESTIKPIAKQPGRPFEVVANSRDVTLRHEYQLAIESLQRRNDSILNAAGEGVIGIDHQAVITFANHTAAEILGYARPEMIGEPASGVLGLCNKQGQRSQKLFDELTAAAESPNFRNGQEACFTTKAGECIPVDCIVTYLDSANPDSGLVLVFRDITERHLIEARLRQSNTVFEHAAEAIMVTDENGVITAVNQAFVSITGYSQAEALGQTPSLLRSGRHDAAFYRRMWQEIRENRCWRGEIWNRRKNGEIFPQWGSIAAVLDSAGKLRNYVTVFSDISEAKKSEAKLKFLANHDPLTSLPNRLMLSEKLNHSLALARENGHRLAIAFVDLDHFKIVNDTLGHLVGDLYLKAIAERIGHALRQEDTLARWGGDEFVIVIDNAPEREQLAEMIHRLQNKLAAPMRLENNDVVPSASIGIAIFPDDGSDVEKLVQSADAAMYRAKETGRNRFEFYTGDLTASARRRFELAWEIRQALQENQFILFYQPQYAAMNGQLIGLEALIRWQHPRRGMLLPGDFMPIADELNLTADIGEWVLKSACEQLKRWEGKLPDNVHLAINIAPVQLNQAFAELAINVIEANGIRTAQLEFEITEGALERRDDILSILNLFSGRGIRLSIDDFGTGYSSLARVRDMPIDYFKIDKCFIDGLPDNTKDAAIVRTIVALASSLGIGTVAEGVETSAQLLFLQDENVDIIQGFYLGRPQPARDIECLLAPPSNP
jgi:diguanylate cyclase (GGDEF)-like protein/PAS domain S-box-containing protein